MVRYLIKYTKESEIKFLSHLDLMRTIQRVIRRAKLPIEYSKGFNPHMSISIAQPLSVGVYSTGEYLDAVFIEEVDEKEILKALNENTVGGVKFLSVTTVARKEGQKNQQAMATIDAAKYIIKFKLKDESALDMDSLMKLSQWTILKKSKSGEKETDIKPLVKEIKYSIDDKILTIEGLLSCGSRENLSASLLSEFIKAHVNGIKEDAFVDIKRVEMYAFRGKELLTLQEYFAQY
ncbi:TIGR03936 family radical SAM-associated protein [uncultured Clostridium sp.]|uniref:TIGR03936 family radical SAM-associated protein n=1 Tax=uncultured Clostridium sp. TaxID=59620 RepID=UPI003217EAB6